MFRRLITWLNRSIHRRLLALLALGLAAVVAGQRRAGPI